MGAGDQLGQRTEQEPWAVRRGQEREKGEREKEAGETKMHGEGRRDRKAQGRKI